MQAIEFIEKYWMPLNCLGSVFGRLRLRQQWRQNPGRLRSSGVLFFVGRQRTHHWVNPSVDCPLPRCHAPRVPARFHGHVGTVHVGTAHGRRRPGTASRSRQKSRSRSAGLGGTPDAAHLRAAHSLAFVARPAGHPPPSARYSCTEAMAWPVCVWTCSSSRRSASTRASSTSCSVRRPPS